MNNEKHNIKCRERIIGSAILEEPLVDMGVRGWANLRQLVLERSNKPSSIADNCGS